MRGGVGRILIVEDDPSIRRLLSIALRSRGYAVDACGDGASGLRRLRTRTHDLLLTDFRLPGMNGVELVRAAREAGSRITVILMSTSSPEELGLPVRERRSLRFLRKPFGLRQLESTVRRALRASAR